MERNIDNDYVYAQMDMVGAGYVVCMRFWKEWGWNRDLWL